MNQVQDIDTTQTGALPQIQTDEELRAVIYEAARKQLILNEAKAAMQAAIEHAKKAHDEATSSTQQEVTNTLARVEAYAKQHRDRLFPKKGSKRAKTHKVLDHDLQFRSSEFVEAPANAVTIIKALIFNLEVSIMEMGECEASTKLAEQIRLLEMLMRQPEPELSKDALKALGDQSLRDMLSAHGIRVETRETFKLSFNFQPEANQ